MCLVMSPSQTVLDVAGWNTNELSLRPLILKHNFISNGCPIDCTLIWSPYEGARCK